MAPSLALVLGAALAGTLGISFVGLLILREVGPDYGYRNAAGVLAIIIGIVTAIMGLMLVRLLLRPIRALSRYAAQIRSRPDASAVPPTRFGTAETSAMAQAVVEMAETLKTREQVIRSFSDHVTHEIKSPASAITAAAELLQDSADVSEADRGLVNQIAGAAAQIDEQLDALRDMARAREAD